VVRHDVVDLPPVKPIDITPTGNGTGTTVNISPIGNDAGQHVVITGAADPAEILDHPEVMPEYEGGMKAMIRFISKNIHYPAAARVTGQEGTVYIRFVVNSLGQVVDVEVLKGVNAMLDREAMRVVTLMKRWKPGSQNNTPVNVRMVLPIKFQLEQ
jgi:protein TonB